MKKELQKTENTIVEKAMEEFNSYFCGNIRKWNREDLYCRCHLKGIPFRKCSAEVFTTPRYTILLSYATIVAFVDKDNSTFYDVLRMVYGYTATSAQHIAKFADAWQGEFNVIHRWCDV